VGIEHRLVGRLEAHIGEPLRETRAASGGIDDEIGRKFGFGSGGASGTHAHARDGAIVVHKIKDFGSVQDLDISNLPDAAADDVVYEGPAGRHHFQAGLESHAPPGWIAPREIGPHVEELGPGALPIVFDSREESREDLLTPGQQGMEVARLRHAGP
jgi:hypothetical protein